VAALRGSRIFGGFLRFFGSIPESGFLGARFTDHGQRAGAITGNHGQPVADRCPLPARFARRLPVAGCRLPVVGSRPAGGGPRSTVHGP